MGRRRLIFSMKRLDCVRKVGKQIIYRGGYHRAAIQLFDYFITIPDSKTRHAFSTAYFTIDKLYTVSDDILSPLVT